MTERKYKWSPFTFLTKDKAAGRKPTQNDFDNFNNFMTVAMLSSSPKYRAYARYLNLKSFAKLDKKHQCMAYNSFNGVSITGKFVGIKKSVKFLNDETIQKVATIMNCSALKAKGFIEDGRIDIKELIECYDDIYHPDR